MKHIEITTKDIISKSKERFGENNYNYDKSNYIDPNTPMTFTCKRHGDFKQMPYYHLTSNGCPRCSKETVVSFEYPVEKPHIKLPEKSEADLLLNKKNKVGRKSLTTPQFIEKANKVHNNKYDYSKTKYIKSSIKVDIICPEHGVFEQRPQSHLKGNGCPQCADIIRDNKKRDNINIFIKKANKVHNNKYDYSNVKYVDNSRKIKIICPEHGEFLQTPRNHLTGSGCQKCAMERQRKKVTKKLEDFINQSNNIHKYFYDYTKVDYINSYTKVKIICPEHGEFLQEPQSHLKGNGCKRCSDVGIKHTKGNILDLIKPEIKRDFVEFEDYKEKLKKEIILELKETKRKNSIWYRLRRFFISLIPRITFDRK